MKLLLVLSGMCVALLSMGTRAEAQNYRWCAIYGGFDDGGTNCGFTTLPSLLLDRIHPSKCERLILAVTDISLPVRLQFDHAVSREDRCRLLSSATVKAASEGETGPSATHQAVAKLKNG
jgi:hypothetical protein